MIYECSIPNLTGEQLKLDLATGRSVVIIGANGSGKTRLGVFIENKISAHSVHRIAAQKTLVFNDDINLISLEKAGNLLRFGSVDGNEGHKFIRRWGNKPATFFLSDFDALLQTLFANHNRIASKHLEERKENIDIPVPTTNLEQLKRIWDKLLPHRALKIQEASVKVLLPLEVEGGYSASEMSDGERVIFYFLGQCLLVPNDAVIIIDEPENHVHKAILGILWDAIEKARPDCGFIYITHDLDFAVARKASTKYFIHSYDHVRSRWDIKELPENIDLPEYVVAEIVGSRNPILFVEGERGSLDLTIYQSLYNGFTVVPIGSCEAVIRSVASYKNSNTLHWLHVHGLIDSDHRDSIEIASLRAQDVYVLPVSEIENMLLLPDVFTALAEAFLCNDPPAQLIILKNDIMREAEKNIDLVSVRYSIRQIDRCLKRVGLEAKDIKTLQSTYQSEIGVIDPTAIFENFKNSLNQAIQNQDLDRVLQLYDNKGLLAFAARQLGLKDQKHLLEKVSRLLGSDNGKNIRTHPKTRLSVIRAQAKWTKAA